MSKTNEVYKKLKRQNGEAFAKEIRKECPIALEDDRILSIVKHAGKNPDDVKTLSKIIHGLLSEKTESHVKAECPLELLDKAGYNAYIVTDKESQNRIEKYFIESEKLCTFSSDRYKNYHIINAVKKNVDEIKRENFKTPERQDEYGTSVISIQCRDGFISIKNRYNHSVNNCDSTFGNNPDNIIEGLKAAIERKFEINLGKSNCDAIENFIIVDNKLFKTVSEINGIYYGYTAVVANGRIVELEDHEYLYEYFIFDLKTKMLRLFDVTIRDSFPEDFNRCYGGRKSLRVDSDGNLMDGDKLLFGVDRT